MSKENDEPKLLPHHLQKELCTSRAPYRQGRKLTAVKVSSCLCLETKEKRNEV